MIYHSLTPLPEFRLFRYSIGPQHRMKMLLHFCWFIIIKKMKCCLFFSLATPMTSTSGSQRAAFRHGIKIYKKLKQTFWNKNMPKLSCTCLLDNSLFLPVRANTLFYLFHKIFCVPVFRMNMPETAIPSSQILVKIFMSNWQICNLYKLLFRYR